MTWVRETEHLEKALESRAGPFQVAGTEKILKPLMTQIQYLEDVAWQIFDARFLELATGFSLLMLGLVVGEPDLGDSEEDLKLRIAMKLRALNSNHRDIDFFELLAIIAGSIWTVDDRPGYVMVVHNSGDEVTSSVLFRMLKIASGDGILIRLQTFEDSSANFMSWGSFDGAIVGADWDSFDGSLQGADWAGSRNQ